MDSTYRLCWRNILLTVETCALPGPVGDEPAFLPKWLALLKCSHMCGVYGDFDVILVF
jgi:hypothetical protein